MVPSDILLFGIALIAMVVCGAIGFAVGFIQFTVHGKNEFRSLIFGLEMALTTMIVFVGLMVGTWLAILSAPVILETVQDFINQATAK